MVSVPEPIHAEFKSKVALERIGMRAKILNLIREYLRAQRSQERAG